MGCGCLNKKKVEIISNIKDTKNNENNHNHSISINANNDSNNNNSNQNNILNHNNKAAYLYTTGVVVRKSENIALKNNLIFSITQKRLRR